MATTTVKTRIKNKIDSLSAWNSSSLVLEDGEIALVRVPTGTTVTNPVTGATEPVVELLMKVGNGTDTFGSLKWLSAKASDVYNWAKSPTAGAVTVSDGTNTKSLTKWFEEATATKKAAADNTTAIATLNKGSSDAGSVAYTVAQAINALDYSPTALTENDTTFVTFVKQVNGKIQVTRRALTEADIPQLSASKINTGDSTYKTLDAMLSHINTEVATVLDDLDVAASAATADATANSTKVKFVTQVTQSDGKIAVKNRNIQAADLPSIPTNKIADGAVTNTKLAFDAVGTDEIQNAAVTNDKIDSVSASKVTLADNKTVSQAIADLQTAVTGGVHFKGVVTAAPTGTSVTIGSTTYSVESNTLHTGDVVIWSAKGKEYIFTGSAWEELGDVDRVGALETAIGNLDYTGGENGAHKFVTQVTQENGLIAATYAQPKASDIIYDEVSTQTVNDVLKSHGQSIADVPGDIADAINALDLATVTGTDNVGNGTIYVIASVGQTNGKVSATTKTLPKATVSQYGITKLSSATSSSSTNLAATPYAVKAAYDKAVEAFDKAGDAQTRIGVVEGNYVHYDATNKKLYVGASTDEIIFDCGGSGAN